MNEEQTKIQHSKTEKTYTGGMRPPSKFSLTDLTFLRIRTKNGEFHRIHKRIPETIIPAKYENNENKNNMMNN